VSAEAWGPPGDHTSCAHQHEHLVIDHPDQWAPPELDADLVEQRSGMVVVVRLPIAHLAPAWAALEEVAGLAERFLWRQPVAAQLA
jgi:hypothetical protein